MTLTTSPLEHPLNEIDISSIAFWSKTFEERERSFARLRVEAPVSWHAPFENPGIPSTEPGFWAVTRAADITAVSLDNDTFRSSPGVSVAQSTPRIQKLAQFFLGMDPPEHTAFRQLVSSSFTPRAIGRISEQIFDRAREIVDSVVGAGEIDIVEDLSAKLPMMTVCDMIGVPKSQHEAVRRAADQSVGQLDPAVVPEGVSPLDFRYQQFEFLHSVGASLAEHRRKHPGDDLVTNLVQAEIDGQRLTDADVGAFMVLMSVAGNDTTKQTTTRTLITLSENPDQRDWLLEDFDGRIMGSVEEFVRHASPVMTFARTASRDTELAGVRISEGDKVGMMYCSGNRDETVFTEPERFDLLRPRTPHVGFGGGGVHYCLGNGVAKTQLRALFGEILTRLPRIELGEPEYLVSNFINGVRHLPAQIGGTA